MSTHKNRDPVQVIISGFRLRAVKYGDSIYLHVPAKLAKLFKIKPNNYVHVAILGVEEVVEKDVEVVK